MALKSCTEISKTVKKLEIEVPAEEFSAACTKAFNKEARNITVPGFRKGKAPRNTVERMYGKEYFYEGAVNELYPTALDEAMKEAKLEPLENGIKLDLVTVEDGKPFVFTAEVSFVPKFKIEGYHGIEITKPSAAVSDEQIEEELKRAQRKEGRTVPVEGKKSENGDIAVFDFEGFMDGVPFDGGKAENYELELGSGQFIPGFEDQMVGHDIGEEFDVNVTFPEEYGAEELAGKPAVFKIKLHGLKKTEYPEIDDEFAKDVSEFDTLEEYKADLRKNLEAAAAERAESAVEGLLIDQLVEKLTVEIPECLVDSRLDYIIKDFAYRIESQGIKFEDYLKYTGTDINAFREFQKPQAERQVKTRLVLEYIAKKEKIKVTDKDIDAEFETMSANYNMPVDQLKSIVNIDELREDIKVERAMNSVKENAVIKSED